VRLGIVTPVVNLNPRFDPPSWEAQGGIDDVVAVARAAESAGYSFVSCPEHICIPTPVAETRGGTYWDPAVALAYVAASTTSIRLLTHVLVLGYHHPLAVLKTYGTLDRASGGRVVLGVGVGTLRPEFELLGVPYADRGVRADEALAAIRAGFGRRAPRHHGDYYRYGDVIVEPHGVQRPPPIWVGGRTRRSLRRALELGDGWIPFGMDLPALEALLIDETLAPRLAERADFDVVLAPEPPLDPLGEPDQCVETMRAYAAAGATALHLRFRHRSRRHYVEQLEAMAALSVD
jgi:probable F420-dependent oxidoreductase